MHEVQAVLFDMDGVIYDTEKIFAIAFEEAAERCGLENGMEYFHSIQGCNDEAMRDIYFRTYGDRVPFDTFYAAVDEVIYRIRDGKEPPMKDTVLEFLIWLKEHRIPTALVSSTNSAVVLRDIKWSGIDTYFDVVIGGDMVSKGKPDPEGYLRAAEKLGAEPACSYVVEDSHNGIRAAGNGGFHPIMIPDTMPVTAEMESLSEAILPDMDALRRYLFE